MQKPEVRFRYSSVLPFVDRFTRVGEVSLLHAWEATQSLIAAILSTRAASLVARALGCLNVTPEKAGALEEGTQLAGFFVAEADSPHRLVLAGEHRLAEYAFIIDLRSFDSGSVRFSIETRAAFKGRAGALYKRLVVESRFHACVMRALLWSANHLAAWKAKREPAQAITP